MTLTHRAGSLHLNADPLSGRCAIEPDGNAVEKGGEAKQEPAVEWLRDTTETKVEAIWPQGAHEIDPESANKQTQDQTEDDEETDLDRHRDRFIMREVHAVNPKPIGVNRSFDTPMARIIAI